MNIIRRRTSDGFLDFLLSSIYRSNDHKCTALREMYGKCPNVRQDMLRNAPEDSWRPFQLQQQDTCVSGKFSAKVNNWRKPLGAFPAVILDVSIGGIKRKKSGRKNLSANRKQESTSAHSWVCLRIY
jgi:hypothetical protein